MKNKKCKKFSERNNFKICSNVKSKNDEWFWRVKTGTAHAPARQQASAMRWYSTVSVPGHQQHQQPASTVCNSFSLFRETLLTFDTATAMLWHSAKVINGNFKIQFFINWWQASLGWLSIRGQINRSCLPSSSLVCLWIHYTSARTKTNATYFQHKKNYSI